MGARRRTFIHFCRRRGARRAWPSTVRSFSTNASDVSVVGRPADVVPKYSVREGVKFRFLDTAVTEAGFRIYRQYNADPNDPVSFFGPSVSCVQS